MLISTNPDDRHIKDLCSLSKHKAAKWIKDPATNAVYCWPAEQARHAEVADIYGLVKYEKGLFVAD